MLSLLVGSCFRKVIFSINKMVDFYNNSNRFGIIQISVNFNIQLHYFFIDILLFD